MDYNTLQEMLPDYIRGFLSEEESHLVQDTLAGSESLRREYEQLRSYYTALDTLEPVKASGTFLNAVNTRIAGPLLLSRLIKKMFMPLHVKLPLELAGLAFTAGLVIIIFNPFNSKNIPPLVFDESSMQAGKAPVDIRMVEESEPEPAEEISELESVVEEKPKPRKERTVSRSIAGKSVQQNEKSTVASAKKDNFGMRGKTRLEDRIKKSHTAGKEESEGQPLAGDKLALLESAPSPSATAGGYADEAEQYVSKVIKESNAIVYQAKRKIPAIDDVGLLALSITIQKSDKQKTSSPGIQKLVTKKKRLRSREKRALKKREESRYSYDSDISAAILEPPASEITFATVKNLITSHQGTATLLQNKPQTPQKKYYLIEIPKEHFPALKKDLESEGTLSDEEFSIETSQTDLIRFNLIISID